MNEDAAYAAPHQELVYSQEWVAVIAVADSSTLLEQGVEYAAPSVRPVSLSRIISFVRICVGLGISTPSGRKTNPLK